ncbi:beta-amyrin 28-monooxygenase-like [Magnolia sinica]|uniref:beta-amyrin 28-monooxygenase-like n=1 Tax=Magnolia sinica TaxID=86752 RepID=UPI002658F651|nr:beta-amyrin 28-monooxygenase-like [Magnolia sinica]
MELVFLSLFLIILSSFLTYRFFFISKRKDPKLPPGSLGWPIIGELLAFTRSGQNGTPQDFVQERMDKHGARIFKTSLLLEPMAVFCGPDGNKFLFSNENKLVASWWPTPVRKIFPSSILTATADKAKQTRKLLMTFLKPEALQKYVGTMDAVARRHFEVEWEGKAEVMVFHLIKTYTFYLACSLFASIEDSDQVLKLGREFDVMIKGILTLPLNIPGTRFYRATRAAEAIRRELRVMIQQRRVDLLEGKASPTQDLLSYLLVTPDDNGQFMVEKEIVDNFLVMLFAGHDTSASTLMMIIKYVAEMPHIYDEILKEQREIAALKGGDELLNWEDIQKMRYSWNVANEVMRLKAPAQGAFRTAIADFTYAGYEIPKGWKLYWSVNTTHRDPEYFPEPEKFDPMRFEGVGPAPYTFTPFGGGPRMCPGKEFARLQILVFLHNLVKRFRWETVFPNEKIRVDPMPAPAYGLPVRLFPHPS